MAMAPEYLFPQETLASLVNPFSVDSNLPCGEAWARGRPGSGPVQESVSSALGQDCGVRITDIFFFFRLILDLCRMSPE